MENYKFRSSLARTYYEKTIRDNELNLTDRSTYYELNGDGCLEKMMTKRNFCQSPHILQLNEDEETMEFLERSKQLSYSFFTQFYYSFVSSVLYFFKTKTDILGLLNCGRMFVLSKKNFQQLLPRSQFHQILDLGSGNGDVTIKLKQFTNNQIDVTEISTTMKSRLTEKNFNVLDIDFYQIDISNFLHMTNDCGKNLFKYSLVTCLNLLDRIEKPKKLLDEIVLFLLERDDSRKIGGILLIALVLPYEPFVEFPISEDKKIERLPVESGSNDIEMNIVNFIEFINDRYKNLNDRYEEFKRNYGGVENEYSLERMHYQLVVKRVARTPYYSEGDLHQSYYRLSDYLFVCELRPLE
ncbi:hypothetical protein SNEBB_004591 [Seison nebaliae]|nr:hypothetical protein SNEBB_004591 [Seison nebaliae]